MSTENLNNMKLTDEILNRYIDDELSTEELKQFNELLNQDEDAVNKLRSLKYVNSTLKEFEPDKAPANITARVMSKLGAISKAAKQTKVFFNVVLSAFSVVTVSVVVYLLSLIKFAGNSSSFIDGVFNDAEKVISEITSLLSNLINSEGVVFMGIFLTAVLLVTGYFVFESHKKFKDELKSFGH